MPYLNESIYRDLVRILKTIRRKLCILDFIGYEVNEYYTQIPGEQTMGVGMAYKVIGEGEDAYTLLAIVVIVAVVAKKKKAQK